MAEADIKSAAQEQRALTERAANALAAAEGRPLPHPNPWDRWDQTKVSADATAAEIQASYARFRQLCQPRPRTRHRL